MTDLMTATATPPATRENTVLLIHEALARSRMSEAEQAAREHRLARSLTAGRHWSLLARFAQRRAERARAGVGAAQSPSGPPARRGVLRSV